MKATVSVMVIFAVAVFTVASGASDKNSTDEDQLISILNQDEPNRLACFPLCFPPHVGKREYVERVAEKNEGEHSARAFNKLRRWLEVKNNPSSPLASFSLVARKLGLKPNWERKARESQSFHRRETADSRSDRQQAFRSSFSWPSTKEKQVSF